MADYTARWIGYLARRIRELRYFIVLFSFCLVHFSAYAEEESSADEMADVSIPTNLMLRQVQTVDGFQPLTVAGQDIDAAYIPSRATEQHGVVVLFHDHGEGFESSGVITPLRHALPDYGWDTLTLSFHSPVMHKVMLSASSDDAVTEAADEEVDAAEQETDETAEASEDKPAEKPMLPPVANIERIEAALVMLQAKGVERVIFLGHGQGAELAIEMLQSKTMPVSGLIWVDMPAVETSVTEGIEIPVLDIYGSQGLAGVKQAVKQRRAMMKRSDKADYTVREIMGANHSFYGLSELLTMTIKSWLRGRYLKQETAE